jgi:two-component system chemotaxis response regulator CheB
VIGSSTGGPRALAALVPRLPRDGKTAWMVVQHMPAGFTASLAERLDATSAVQVREARAGDRLLPGTALVAPGDFHLRISSAGKIGLDQALRVHGVRPSVDVTLASAAQHLGPRVVAAVLTGMGQDGAEGALSVRRAGGHVLAEDASSCVVYGMPRAVVERNAADRIVPLDDMGAAIGEALRAAPSPARSA